MRDVEISHSDGTPVLRIKPGEKHLDVDPKGLSVEIYPSPSEDLGRGRMIICDQAGSYYADSMGLMGGRHAKVVRPEQAAHTPEQDSPC